MSWWNLFGHFHISRSLKELCTNVCLSSNLVADHKGPFELAAALFDPSNIP